MTPFIRRMRDSVVLTTLLCFLMVCPPSVFAESPVQLQRFTGTINITAPGPVIPFTLEGEASHLGQFTSYGEVVFTPGQETGTLVGNGVAVFRAANGDLLVGVVTWTVGVQNGDYRSTGMHFSWRDSVTFNNGDVVSSTGRFVTDRPPGLVVIAIIAILIGLLLPA
jgi:hypothetical protein